MIGKAELGGKNMRQTVLLSYAFLWTVLAIGMLVASPGPTRAAKSKLGCEIGTEVWDARQGKCVQAGTSSKINTQMSPDWTRCVNEGNAFSPDVAISGCTAVINSHKGTPSSLAIAYSNRGNAYTDKGDFDRAIADGTMAIAINPRDATAYVNRGSAYDAKGEHDLAIYDQTRAIGLDPSDVVAYTNRGLTYGRKGEYDRAIANFRTALSLPARSPPERLAHARAREVLATWAQGFPPAAPQLPQGPKNAPETVMSGTGIVVSNDGSILTNAHVVRNCKRIRVNRMGLTAGVAQVVAADQANDLALLKADTSVAGTTLLPFKRDPRVGEIVFAYGFPLSGFLPSSGNFTSGNITAIAGINDDVTKLQFSAPVQPGNSGGPLFDRFGNIVGVVVATVDVAKFAESTKALPQNINFAIKSSVAVDFLKTHRVIVATASNTQQLAPEDVADRAASVSVHIVCNLDPS